MTPVPMSRIPMIGNIKPISRSREYLPWLRPTANTNMRHIPVPKRIFLARSAGVIDVA